MKDQLTEAHPISDGGLDHLQRAMTALEDDFTRLDQTIEGLVSLLSLSFVEPELGDGTEIERSPRSVIDSLTRRVRYLQQHSERQRGTIERIREAIQ